MIVNWVISALAILAAGWLLPNLSVEGIGGALLVAVVIAAVNAVVPPVLAAIRLPYTVAVTFLLVLAADAGALMIADAVTKGAIKVGGFFDALVAALLIAAVTTILDVIVGANDDDAYSLRVTHRLARRAKDRIETDTPGIVYLEIDGLAFPVLQRAMRDGNAPEMARWLTDGTHRMVEWETDLSSQTGASQAGILLGSNEDIPAFRWVEKERGALMVCSNPDNCAEIERRRSEGNVGLLADGGASRGNLLSGGADHVLLTVSRISEEKKANPGYRAFFANGFNVTRVLVLFFWEVILEVVASARQRRRDVHPRGHRGGKYPFVRAGVGVVVRDLTVNAVISDMFHGRPAIYATFASYDEVAHHSGLERPDTLEALRKLDEQFGRVERARRYAPRPYQIVVLSDHGQTQGATFKQRNGYGLDELVRRTATASDVRGCRRRGRKPAGRRHGVRRGDRKGRAVRQEARAEAGRERRGRGRPRVGQPRPHLPDGRVAPADPGGDRGAPPAADPRAQRAPRRRLPARALIGGRGRGDRRRRQALPVPRPCGRR